MTLLLLFGSLLGVLFLGMPAAFGFLFLNLVGLVLLLGPERSLGLVVPSALSSITNFAFAPLPLFVLMGEILLRSGLAKLSVDAVDNVVGRMPGRLSVVAVEGGAIFGAVSGSSMASVAMLGSVLGPEMDRRGYKPQMSAGAIVAAASLDPLIPPSALAVILGAIANVSIGALLLAGTGPGLILAVVYAIYFVVRAKLQPSMAPPYSVPEITWRARLQGLVHLLPLVALMLMVTGLILFGVATPSESAALGAVTAALLAAANRRLTFEVLRQAARATVATTAMVLMIIVNSKAFSQVLAVSGAGSGWIRWVTDLPVVPIATILGFLAIVFILGMFVEPTSIMLITVPLFMPAVTTLGYDPLWFALLMLINLNLGNITPPFGLILFVLKGVRPELRMAQIARAVWPIILMQVAVLLLYVAFPDLTYVFTPAKR